jgi:hypothetical protein
MATMDNNKLGRQQLQIGLGALFLLVALVCGGLGLWRRLQVEADRAAASDVRRRIELVLRGVTNYCAIKGHLPSPQHDMQLGPRSWRFELIPYLESRPDYSEITTTPIKDLGTNALFCFPYPGAQPTAFTNILAVTGTDCAFDQARQTSIRDLDSDTILLIESRSSMIHWADPGDFRVDVDQCDMPSVQPCFHVGFADGSVWRMRKDTPMDCLKPFFTIAGAKQYDRFAVLERYRVE